MDGGRIPCAQTWLNADRESSRQGSLSPQIITHTHNGGVDRAMRAIFCQTMKCLSAAARYCRSAFFPGMLSGRRGCLRA